MLGSLLATWILGSGCAVLPVAGDVSGVDAPHAGAFVEVNAQLR